VRTSIGQRRPATLELSRGTHTNVLVHAVPLLRRNAVVGVLLVVGCVLGAHLVRPGLEEGSGPRTAVARILKVLAFTAVAAGAFLVVSRPGGT